jgi:kinesin family protein 5
MADSIIEYTVKVSYMEIYMEKIKDLLARKLYRPEPKTKVKADMSAQQDNLSIHEDKARGVYVKGLTDVYVGSKEDVYKVMQAGSASRSVSSTSKLPRLSRNKADSQT